jgi:alpha-tubulin suppressor-like RCC1 family protein
LAWDLEGYVYGWGENNYGQSSELRDKFSVVTTPNPVSDFLDAQKIISCLATETGSIAINSKGVLFCWGNVIDSKDKLYHGVNKFNARVMFPDFKNKVIKVACSKSNFAFADSTNSLYAFGLK